jgi:hypothetical protein
MDYLSCILTLVSTALVGKKRWQGFAIASVNSALICILARDAKQWGLIPANVFCMALYAKNIKQWRKEEGGKSEGRC